jgi:hypothetical protein
MELLDPELIHQRQQIVRRGAGLRSRRIDLGASPAAPVDRNRAIAGSRERDQLVLPDLTRSRRRMHEHHGLTRPTRIAIEQTNAGKRCVRLADRRERPLLFA